VIQEGGFERAARVLFLTQSAVSQRVRQLEESSGQILISRTTPPLPTAAGKMLLNHYQQVKLLEEGLSSELTTSSAVKKTTLAIGINADSLAHWFIAAINPILQQTDLLIDLRVDDQEQTHRYLREGNVVGCISTEASAIQGCRVAELGTMIYRLLATPAFINRWFPGGLSLEDSKHAPAVIFNHKDRLHYRFFEQYLGMAPKKLAAHYIPAPDQFLRVIAEGNGYGMVPDWQGNELLESGQLQELVPGATLRVDLYWHCWNLAARPLQEFSAQLIAGARNYFAPPF
ncbi:MAG: LysR family transcriptional regulator ArgP, partial [Thermodesulfobacteriota bacterium]|nr:LysR family transcriptional regulator ArgP [Thermodesulfobacteriota bacterium]